MKTMLIPTEDHDAMPAVLEGARLLARTFDSYMEGFAVRPSPGTYVTVEPVSSLAISGDFEPETAKEAQASFEAFMKAHKVPPGGQAPATYSYGWPRADAAEDAYIGSYGRVFDLIVLGRPGASAENPRMPPLESALFDAGRPVLIVPKAVPKTIGRNILVAWNRSTEQAHTNTFAMPLLQGADKVTVLMVEGGATTGPTGEEAALHLKRNGVKAEALTLKKSERNSAEAIGEITLEQAASLGCDLVVKSAYTQSRLRQMIFGGATRHILANATLPVLMAH
ncbi:MAG: universal stress protein [Pseudolabrys sp.]|nr:universal stress protein [Pseudolabrys sp.]MDP2296733.1 universal stress protein [Pseudolabrys sp.]